MLSDVVISVPGKLTGSSMKGSVTLSRTATRTCPGDDAGRLVEGHGHARPGSPQDVTSALAITDVDVQVLWHVEVVPEPRTVALLGLGVLGGYPVGTRTLGRSDRVS